MFTRRYVGILKNIISNSHIIDTKRYLQQTHYEVLGLPKNCNAKDIREAFIKLSKRYHPDRNTRNASKNNFVKVLEAYSVLSKPDSRCHYDWELTQGTMRNPNDFQEPSQYRTRAGGYSTGSGYDETSKTDKSQYRYYQNAPYYGVPGINSVSSAVIGFICYIITVVGVTLQYLSIRHSMLRRSMENENLFTQIQAEAERNGNELYIEIMERSFQNSEYYKYQNPHHK